MEPFADGSKAIRLLGYLAMKLLRYDWLTSHGVRTLSIGSHPCTRPRRSGAGVGIGMLRGAENSPTWELKKRSLFSWFLGSLVSWFQSLLVSKPL